jgi:hypothetical protein
VVPHYLGSDPESLGYAAVIEWVNPRMPGTPSADFTATSTAHSPSLA